MSAAAPPAHRLDRRADDRVQPDAPGERSICRATRRHVQHAHRRRPPGRAGGLLHALGDDEFGRMFLKLWAAEGVDARAVALDPAAFTRCTSLRTARGPRLPLHRAGYRREPDAPEDLLCRCSRRGLRACSESAAISPARMTPCSILLAAGDPGQKSPRCQPPGEALAAGAGAKRRRRCARAADYSPSIETPAALSGLRQIQIHT